MATPDLTRFTDDEIANGLRRLGLTRLKLIIPKLWSILEADTRKALGQAIVAAPEIAADIAAATAAGATRNFMASLLSKGSDRGGS